MPTSRLLTAADLAAQVNLAEKQFRARMRRASFSWHRHGESWAVEEGSAHHREMMDFLGARASAGKSPTPARRRTRDDSDEAYIIDICDRVLGQKASRGHRFPWLVGDELRPVSLPVDAHYPALALVIEFLERQHSEAVKHFDKPDVMTVSGVHRGQQRALYDQRRREHIPAHGLRLVEIRVDELAHDGRKKLLRLGEQDEVVIREKLRLAGVLPRPPV